MDVVKFEYLSGRIARAADGFARRTGIVRNELYAKVVLPLVERCRPAPATGKPRSPRAVRPPVKDPGPAED